MKKTQIAMFIAFLAMNLLWFSNAYGQTQSWLLPIPGATSPDGPCKMINFADYSNPVITDLPSHTFYPVSGTQQGNPHIESDLHSAINPSTLDYLMEEQYLGQHPMFAQAVVHDNDGNLLFFIIDNNIYNRFGEVMLDINPNFILPAHLLSNQVEPGANIFDNYNSTGYLFGNEFNRFSSNGVMLDPEIAIFPIPGSCYKYGMVFSFYKHGAIANATEYFYRTIEFKNDDEVFMSEPLALTLHGIDGNLAVGCDDYSMRATAVSPLRPDNSRAVFINFYNRIYVFSVDNTGDISYENDFGPTETYSTCNSSLTFSNNPEMEVFEKSDNGVTSYYLATSIEGKLDPNDSWARLYLYNIDYSTLSLLSYTSVDVPNTGLSGSNEEFEEIKGIEFSPNGDYIYVNYYGQEHLYCYDLGLYEYTINTGSNDPSLFQYSQIELGRDGNLYMISYDDITQQGSVARIINPNTPSAATVQNNCFPSINSVFRSFESPYNSAYTTERSRLFTIEDQIDGSDYQTNFDSDLDCCVNHVLYQVWPETSEFDQNPNWIWDAGVTNNPFACQTVAYFDDDVVIPAGRTLTVKNMELRFAEGVKLTIEQDATLILENCTLGAVNKCHDHTTWVGVEVMGQINQSQIGVNDQAKIIMHNSVIENAEVGVFTGLLDDNGYFDVAYSGGIIQAYNSTFRNCERSAMFLKYRNFLPSTGQTLNNISVFRNCEFVLDDLNPHSFGPVDFVRLYGVYNVRFNGCVFNDLRSNPGKRIDGIYSIDSKFAVDELCLSQSLPNPCTNVQKSVFNELKYGIYAVSFNPLNNISVNNCEFSQNWRDIYVRNTRNSVIKNNTFDVGFSDQFFSNGSYGLYLENSTGYTVQDNNFNSIYENAFGCIINNSGTASNLIYRNEFENMQYAIEALNTNGSTGNGTSVFSAVHLPFYNGLQFKCNEFTSNVSTDIAYTSGVVKKAQGHCSSSISSPAGNIFNSTPAFENLSANPGVFPYIYSHHDVGSPIEPTVNSVDITLNPCSQTSYVFATACPLAVRPPATELQDIITLANSTLKNAYDLIDGGNTQTLLDEISTGTNTGTLKNMLVDASPYLSDTVMVAAINSPVPMSPGNLKEVLIPNSPLTPVVWTEVENADLPKGIMNELESVQAGISQRAQLEAEIAAALDTLYYYENMLLDYYLNDTTSAGLSDLTSFYSTQEDAESQKLLVMAAIANNDIALAKTTLAFIPQNSVENIAFTDFYAIMIDLADSSRTIEDLNPTELAIIENIANSETSISANAENILIALGLVEHEELIQKLILPDEYYLDGYLYDNYLCGNNRIEGDTLVLLNQSGEPIEFVTPAVTDANGYFRFDANELAYIDDRTLVTIGAKGGFALENTSFQQFGTLMDSKPIDLTMVPVNYEWEALYSNRDSMNNYATALDLNENLYVVGYCYSQEHGTETHLLRYDPMGNMVWDVPYVYVDSSQSECLPRDLATDDEGNVLVSIYGRLGSVSEIFTVKYDSNGVKLWETAYSTPLSNFPVALDVLSDGSCVVVANNGTGIVLLKYSQAGSLLWSSDYQNARVTGLEVDEFGNVYISGLTADAISNQGAFIAKYNPDGQFAWVTEERKAGIISKGGFKMDNEGAFILSFASGNNQTNFYKFNNAGQMIWEKTMIYNGIPSYDIVVDSMNNIYGINTTNNSLDFFKWNSNGSEVWTLNVPVEYQFQFLEPAKLIIGDDNTLYFGTTASRWVSSGFFFKWFSEYNIGAIANDGSLLWHINYKSGDNEINSIADIKVSSNNNVYATGTTKFEIIDGLNTIRRNMFSTVKFAQCPMLANLRNMEDNPEANSETEIPESEFVSVFPNPSSGVVYIEYNIASKESGVFELFTNTGVSVLKLELPTGYQIVSIDKSLLAPGMYHYTAQSDGVDIGNGKLLIVK